MISCELDDEDSALWAAVDELDGAAIAASIGDGPTNGADTLPGESVPTQDPAPERSSRSITKKNGRARAVASRYRKKYTKSAPIAESLTISSSEEMNAFLTTTKCLREHLNRLFDNPRSDNELLALPGRCCSNCNPATGPTDNSKQGNRKKRARKLDAHNELANTLIKWRDKKALSMGFMHPSFVFPDHLIDTLAAYGSLDSVDDLRKCTHGEVVEEAQRELYGLITEFAEDRELQNDVNKLMSKKAKVRDRQSEAQARLRKNRRTTLKDAMALAGTWGEADMMDVPEQVRDDLAFAREVVRKDKVQKANRATKARERRQAAKKALEGGKPNAQNVSGSLQSGMGGNKENIAPFDKSPLTVKNLHPQ